MRKLDNILIILLAVFLLAGGLFAYRTDMIQPDWFPHHWSAVLFVILYSSWVLVELFNFFYARKNSRDSEEKPVSLSIAITSEFVLILILIIANVLSYDFKEDFYYGSVTGILQYLGFLLMFLGILYRQVSISHLGKNFSTGISPNDASSLIKTGPYRTIRNPAYTGSILTIVGVPLALGTWLAAMIVAPMIIFAYLIRIRSEEKELIGKYGAEYEKYMKATYRLFPGI